MDENKQDQNQDNTPPNAEGELSEAAKAAGLPPLPKKDETIEEREEQYSHEPKEEPKKQEPEKKEEKKPEPKEEPKKEPEQPKEKPKEKPVEKPVEEPKPAQDAPDPELSDMPESVTEAVENMPKRHVDETKMVFLLGITIVLGVLSIFSLFFILRGGLDLNFPTRQPPEVEYKEPEAMEEEEMVQDDEIGTQKLLKELDELNLSEITEDYSTAKLEEEN